MTESDQTQELAGKPMLIYRRTSLLESTAQTLVNTVNCVGVMGKGIAKHFKECKPEMFFEYKRICEKKLLAPGKLWLWRGADSLILNFPTKQHSAVHPNLNGLKRVSRSLSPTIKSW